MAMTSRRVAITGARGRIARFVATDLARRGHEVSLFSRTPDARHRALASLPGVAGDFDAILHLGWSTIPRTAEENPGSEQREDIPFLGGLLAAMETAAVSTQFVFFSTTAVYGDVEVPADETSPCRPIGRYAAGKLEAEKVIASHPDVASCVLRVSNVFGFSSHSEKPQGIIPLLCDAVRDDQPVSIWGDGHATKDYLFHEDFLDALHRVLNLRLTGLFNLAAGRSFSLHEIMHRIENASGRRLQVLHAPHFPWDVESTLLSSAKLAAATGWRPTHDVEEGIRALFRNQP